MKKKNQPKLTPLEETQNYVDFLKKALASKNFKENEPEKYAEYQKKYDKAKLRLKFLKDGNK